jgi:glycosyltransferase involved in cell wall biosynthesis
MKKNVIFLGGVSGSYRTQYLIKFFLDNYNKYQIHYSSPFYFTNGGGTVSNRVISKIIRTVGYFFYILHADVVVVPVMSKEPYFWYKFARVLKKQIVVDFYISDYDRYVLDMEVVPKGSNKAKKLAIWDKFLIELGNPVIFLSEAEKKYYCDLVDAQVQNDHVKIVPFCIEGRSLATLPYFNNVTSTPVICWWGNFLPLHGIERIIEAAGVLRKKQFVFKMILFGNPRHKHEEYAKRIADLDLSNFVSINTHATFGNGELEDFLQTNCDLALGGFGISKKAKTVLLNKICDALAMGIPVLTANSEALQEHLNTESDVFVTENDVTSIADNIIDILSDKEVALKRSINGLSAYNRLFSIQSYFKNLRDIY